MVEIYELVDINKYVFFWNFIKFIINSLLNKLLLYTFFNNIVIFIGNWLEIWLGIFFIIVLYKFDKKWVINSDVS